MKYYVIAGERSGDLHASNLIKALKRYDDAASFRGFGGDYMQAAGLDLVVHYADLAFMGLTGLITNARTIARRLRQCKEDILSFSPEVVILVDFAGFNRQIAKWAKPRGIKIYYYISPKVWAWYQVRALELKRNVDKMFCILPFEKDFFKKYDWEVDYVGNPVLDAIKAFEPTHNFLQQQKIKSDQKLVALLPGSRRNELKRMVPLMKKVIKANPQYHFAVAALKSLPAELYRPLEQLPNAQLVFDATYDLLAHARAAIVTSGTATLETGLFKVPQVVVYRLGSFEYLIGKSVVKVKHISLINLIANDDVIRELIQRQANPNTVNVELNRLVEEGPYRTKMLADYEQVYKILDTGSASDNAARLMVGYLNGKL